MLGRGETFKYFMTAVSGLFMLAVSGCGEQPPPAPDVPIGGAFTLSDTTGETVTEDILNGHYSLIYFGYTFCPDVCPGALEIMSLALDDLGRDAEAVTPIFITVDPERDSRAVIADYLSNFHPRFIGLRGTPEQIKEAARAYRIHFAKAEQTADQDYYLMNHSSIIFFMGPQGQYLDHFSHGTPPDQIAETIDRYL